MQWNLDQLSAFVAVCEHGSFSAAARDLRRVQSAVSQAVALLEDDLGVRLFERSGGRLPKPTAAGETLLHEAREVLRQCQRLERRALALGGGEEQHLRLVLDEAFTCSSLAGALVDLAERFAFLELTLAYGTQGDISGWVSAGQADLGVLFQQEHTPAGLEQAALGEMPLVLVCGQQHPLAQLEQVDRRALAAHRQLLIAARTSLQPPSAAPAQPRHELERLSPTVWRADSFYAIAELAMSGLGWAVIPRDVAHYPMYRERLVELRGELPAYPSLGVELVWRRDRPLGPAAQFLRSALARTFSQDGWARA